MSPFSVPALASSTRVPPSWALGLPWGARSQWFLDAQGSPPPSFLSTFIDRKEALPNPVAAAAEFNPEAAVSGDDRLGEFGPTEAAYTDSMNRRAVRPEVRPSALLTPGLYLQEVTPPPQGTGGSGLGPHWAYIPKTTCPPAGPPLAQGLA